MCILILEAAEILQQLLSIFHPKLDFVMPTGECVITMIEFMPHQTSMVGLAGQRVGVYNFISNDHNGGTIRIITVVLNTGIIVAVLHGNSE